MDEDDRKRLYQTTCSFPVKMEEDDRKLPALQSGPAISLAAKRKSKGIQNHVGQIGFYQNYRKPCKRRIKSSASYYL
jgi:hypothetical protein